MLEMIQTEQFFEAVTKPQTSTMIFGSAGEGKTNTLRAILEYALRNGTHTIVVGRQDEYKDLAMVLGGAHDPITGDYFAEGLQITPTEDKEAATITLEALLAEYEKGLVLVDDVDIVMHDHRFLWTVTELVKMGSAVVMTGFSPNRGVAQMASDFFILRSSPHFLQPLKDAGRLTDAHDRDLEVFPHGFGLYIRGNTESLVSVPLSELTLHIRRLHMERFRLERGN